MKLTTLKPRISTAPGRLQMAATLQVDRLRGRAAVKRRANWLHDHPLCNHCEEAVPSRVAAAVTPDHIVPLWAGGADDESNLQSLCAADHDAKTACEARMRAAGGWMATACTCGQHG